MTALPTEPPSIDPADLDSRLAGGWQLVDVRTDAEWAEGRIAGAVHIPLDQLLARVDEVHDPVVFSCASGRRSAQATAYFVNQGREAVNLDGGLHRWSAEGRPVESGPA